MAGRANLAHCYIPDSYHVVVHLLQFRLGGVEGIWRRVKLIGLEALIGELDLERFFVGLQTLRVSIASTVAEEASRIPLGHFPCPRETRLHQS